MSLRRVTGPEYHTYRGKVTSDASSNYSSPELPRLHFLPRLTIESIEQKIKLSLKILRRYKQTEKNEMDAMISNMEKIRKMENSCYSSVDVLLRKYASLDRWGFLGVKCGYILEALLKHELRVMTTREDLRIKDIEEEINDTNVQTELIYGDGAHLIDYVCTSYAEMVVTIEEIKNHHKLLQFAFDWEKEEMKKRWQEFIRKTNNRLRNAEGIIKSGIQKDTSAMMSVKTLELGQQNECLRRNLEKLRKDNVKAEKIARRIRKHLDDMQIDPENDARKKFFPEIFYKKADCKPDTILELDIPIKTYIPI